MTEMTAEQQEALEAAGWTEEELAGFAQALVSFRDGLPPRQREAFTAILATATAAIESSGDVQGYAMGERPEGYLFGGGLAGLTGFYISQAIQVGSVLVGIKAGLRDKGL